MSQYTLGIREYTQPRLGKPSIVHTIKGILCDGKWWADAPSGATDESILADCAAMERNDRLAEELKASMSEAEYRLYLDESSGG